MLKNKLMITCGFSLLAGTSLAGGLDRSTLNPSLLFSEGNAFQIGLSYVDPTIKGTMGGGAVDLGDMAPSYMTYSLGYKSQINDQLAYAITLDTPYGANVDYSAASPIQGTKADLSSYRMTMLLKYTTNGFSIYGGPVIEQIGEGTVDIPLVSYTLSSDKSLAYGYAVGAAYEFSDYAMRVALTYASAINHDIDVTEMGAATGTMTITTPQSVALDLQTGINDRTLLTGSVRWSNWSAFSIEPPAYTQATGGPLFDYENDSMTYSLGMGYKLTEQWALLTGIEYEAPTGGDASLLAPTDGRTSISLGAQYQMNDSKFRFGVSYSMLGDASGTSPAAFEFKDNSAIGVGLSYTQSF